MPEKQTVQQFGASIKAKHPEYKDMDDAALGKAVLAKYPQYSDLVDEKTIQNVPGAVPGMQEPQAAAGPKVQPMSHVFTPQEFGKGFIGTIPAMLKHPGATVESMVQGGLAAGMSPTGEGYPAFAPTGRSVDSRNNATIQANAQEGQIQAANAIKENPGYAAGGATSLLTAGALLPKVVPGLRGGGAMIRDAAIGDVDAAALRGLRVPSGSPKIQSTLRSVEGARPYLQGANSLEDLQSRIPAAKNEIWGKYKGTVDHLADKPVQGPDGQTTVGELEAERQQLSALNRGLKKGAPDALQLAQQKGMTQAQLLDRERAVQSALDPHLEQAGIDPKLIRQTFGQVADVGSKIAGKSTIIEPKQAYGLSRLKDVSLTRPLSNVPLAGGIARDLAAGRYLSASPTDVGIREGFRTGGAKPDFRAPSTSMPPFDYPPKQLPSSAIGNADFGEDHTQGGFPAQPVRTGQAPPSRLALPTQSGAGEAQPMIRYARPYVEPPEPSTIRPMPPQQRPALAAQASPGETQPYIAHRTIQAGPAGESTRITSPQFLSPSEPLPSALRTADAPLPAGAEGPTRGLRTAPRGLLPGAQETIPAPDPTTAHVFPAGSAFRNLPPETPFYPPGSQFRPKAIPFDIDEYLRQNQ